MPPNPVLFVAERFAALLRKNPDLYDLAIELNIIDEDWLKNPTPLNPAAATIDTMRRFAERAAERSPSVLAALGLNALQLLSWDQAWNRRRGRTTPEHEVAVLFIDLQGFTQFTSDNGDAAALAVLEKHKKTVGPIVRRWDGRIVKRIGDGTMIVFEDRLESVQAAIELINAEHALAVRAGIHWGTAIVSDRDVFGNVVNLAARIGGRAEGDQLLISQDVYEAVCDRPEFAFAGPEEMQLKGIGESVAVWRVSAAANLL